MILAVQHIQFAAYSRRNLNLLATLCNWLGGLLTTNTLAVTSTTNALTSSVAPMVDEIHATLGLMLESKRSVALIAVSLPAREETQPYVQHFNQLVQGSNRLWQMSRADRTVLVMLLPLSNPERFERYHANIEANFHRHFGTTPSKVGVELSAHHIRQYANKHELVSYLRAA